MGEIGVKKREGSCVYCGKCCKPPVMFLNHCIDRGQKQCKFYGKPNGAKFGNCLIMGRAGAIEAVVDAEGRLVTQAQIDWYERNCPPYPLETDMVDKGYKPPDGCGFYLSEVGL